MAQKRKDKAKKRVVHVDAMGQVHIKASFNNIIISITNTQGQVVSWASAGKMGFKGPKKATAYAAGVIVRNDLEQVEGRGLKEVDAFVKGVGTGREAAIRAFNANGIDVVSIKDITPIPHNGCRPKKVRRV